MNADAKRQDRIARTFSVLVSPALAGRIVALQKRRRISRGQAMRELMIAGVRHRERCLGKRIN